MLLPLTNPRAFSRLPFRAAFLGAVLMWMIALNHLSESPTYVIAMGGIALWYFSQERTADSVQAGAKFFQTRIRRNIRLAEAPSFGQSIFQYAPTSNGAHSCPCSELSPSCSSRISSAGPNCRTTASMAVMSICCRSDPGKRC